MTSSNESKNSKTEGGRIIQYDIDKTHSKDIVKVMYEGKIESIKALKNDISRRFSIRVLIPYGNIFEPLIIEPEKIINAGQSPRINLLLYGSTGTGKSTFAYRIAMATKRHLMSINVSKYKKDELAEIFTRPKIKGTVYQPKDIVYVLDEFDMDIDQLLLREICQKEQIGVVKDVVTTMFKTTKIEDSKPVIQQSQPQCIVVTSF